MERSIGSSTYPRFLLKLIPKSDQNAPHSTAFMMLIKKPPWSLQFDLYSCDTYFGVYGKQRTIKSSRKTAMNTLALLRDLAQHCPEVRRHSEKSNANPPSIQYDSNILYFDGALKSNPGVAMGGGILLFNGNLIFKFVAGLGKASNKFAKSQALKLGTDLAAAEGVHQLQVDGESELILIINAVKLSDNKRAFLQHMVKLITVLAKNLLL
ncbi:hypothetical protein SUGI_0092680 [Cryptomeria japonica]|nr:hypothetical protein SUGI_0092680 [Cryptomeria japonica]